MLAKRIIPCLDVQDGMVVKGIHFEGIREVGDPVECAVAYKVSVNSAAIRNPELIRRAADKFGSQCVVVAVDAKRRADGGWGVFINGGRIDTGLDALDWVRRCEQLGAGEILLTSMDADGTKQGFDLPLTEQVSKSISIPVIASGGCGKLEDFSAIFEKTGADAALAASLFHDRRPGQGAPAAKRDSGAPGRRKKMNLDLFFQKGDLIPAIVQEASTGQVLMLAYMNRESLEKTLSTGYTWFYSRSRKTLWNKGASSGHRQKVQRMYYDCDEDTILAVVEQTGNACHTGAHSCFYRAFPGYEK